MNSSFKVCHSMVNISLNVRKAIHYSFESPDQKTIKTLSILYSLYTTQFHTQISYDRTFLSFTAPWTIHLTISPFLPDGWCHRTRAVYCHPYILFFGVVLTQECRTGKSDDIFGRRPPAIEQPKPSKSGYVCIYMYLCCDAMHTNSI